jgi:Tol biopolymer transport system component
LGLTWLPDGSGFLYSVTEGYGQKGNMYEYNFSTGESIPITNYTSGYVRRMSVSADGSQVVYERQELGEWTDLNPSIDLWIMNLNGGGQALLVENAKGPSWSYQTPSVPTPPTQPSPTQPAPTQPAPIDLSNAVFLPFINR